MNELDELQLKYDVLLQATQLLSEALNRLLDGLVNVDGRVQALELASTLSEINNLPEVE